MGSEMSERAIWIAESNQKDDYHFKKFLRDVQYSFVYVENEGEIRYRVEVPWIRFSFRGFTKASKQTFTPIQLNEEIDARDFKGNVIQADKFDKTYIQSYQLVLVVPKKIKILQKEWIYAKTANNYLDDVPTFVCKLVVNADVLVKLWFGDARFNVNLVAYLAVINTSIEQWGKLPKDDIYWGLITNLPRAIESQLWSYLMRYKLTYFKKIYRKIGMADVTIKNDDGTPIYSGKCSIYRCSKCGKLLLGIGHAIIHHYYNHYRGNNNNNNREK